MESSKQSVSSLKELIVKMKMNKNQVIYANADSNMYTKALQWGHQNARVELRES